MSEGNARFIADATGNTVGVTDDNRLKVEIAYEDHTHDQYATTALLTSTSGTLQDQIDNLTLDHSDLNNLDYASSGHTGFASLVDLVDAAGVLDSKIDTTSGTLQDQINNLTLDHSDLNNLDYASSGHTGFASTDDVIWEIVDTPTNQIRPKSAHINKALYHGGSVTLAGDLTVSGTVFTTYAEEVYVGDKLITLNWGETGAGVSGSPYSGVEIDRGTEINYYCVFDETNDDMKVGVSGTLQSVATRETSPTDQYVAYWNDSDRKFDTVSGISISTLTTNNHARSHAMTSTSDHTAGNWKTLYTNGSGQVVELANGTANQVLTSNGASAAPSWADAGGSADLDSSPDSDHTGSGITSDMTVDVNATGFGAALYIASDGNLEEADASSSATMPCMGMALESGTGTKSILLSGFIRDDSWAWTSGGKIYVSTTTGALTQTVPSGSGDQVQVVGVAKSADIVYFFPSLLTLEVE